MAITLNKKTRAYELPVKMTWQDLSVIRQALALIPKPDAQISELQMKISNHFTLIDEYIRKINT